MDKSRWDRRENELKTLISTLQKQVHEKQSEVNSVQSDLKDSKVYIQSLEARIVEITKAFTPYLSKDSGDSNRIVTSMINTNIKQPYSNSGFYNEFEAVKSQQSESVMLNNNNKIGIENNSMSTKRLNEYESDENQSMKNPLSNRFDSNRLETMSEDAASNNTSHGVILDKLLNGIAFTNKEKNMHDVTNAATSSKPISTAYVVNDEHVIPIYDKLIESVIKDSTNNTKFSRYGNYSASSDDMNYRDNGRTYFNSKEHPAELITQGMFLYI